MNKPDNRSAVHVAIAALIVVAAGLVLAVGVALASIPLALAAIIAIGQRTNLARSLRTSDTNLRHRRLVTSAALGALSVMTIAVFMADVGTEDEWGDRVVVYNLAFTVTAMAAMIYLVAGLLTKKSPPEPSVQATSP